MPESLLRGIRPQWPQTQPKLGPSVGCISLEMTFSISSILAPNVCVNTVPVPSTTQYFYPDLGPSQWTRSNYQQVSLAPPNPNSVHQRLSYLRECCSCQQYPKPKGQHTNAGSYTPAFWHAFPSTSMLQPTLSGTTQLKKFTQRLLPYGNKLRDWADTLAKI